MSSIRQGHWPLFQGNKENLKGFPWMNDSLLCPPDGLSFSINKFNEKSWLWWYKSAFGFRILRNKSESISTASMWGCELPHHILVRKNRLKDKYYIAERCLWTVINTKTCYLTTNNESSVSRDVSRNHFILPFT